MSKITWFEILCEGDHQRLADFYLDVFGWRFLRQDLSYEYYMLENEDEVGMGGGIMDQHFVKNSTMINGYVNSVLVGDIDPYIKKVQAAGGKLLAPKHPIPGVGWHAYLRDPEGNVFGLMDESKKSDR